MADNQNFYGVATYGNGIYGDAGPISPSTIVIPYPEVPGYCPQYLRFQLSGVKQGLYVFELNPSSYDPYPQRTTQSYKNILAFEHTIDEPYNKLEIDMHWDEMSNDMWNALVPYSRKKVDGTSEYLYFWDSHVNRFQGHRIKIESLKCDLKGGHYPLTRFNVSMRIRVATI